MEAADAGDHLTLAVSRKRCYTRLGPLPRSGVTTPRPSPDFPVRARACVRASNEALRPYLRIWPLLAWRRGPVQFTEQNPPKLQFTVRGHFWCSLLTSEPLSCSLLRAAAISPPALAFARCESFQRGRGPKNLGSLLQTAAFVQFTARSRRAARGASKEGNAEFGAVY